MAATDEHALKAIPYYELLRSEQFTFIVGQNKEAISVHSKAISSLSPALDRLMHGQMNEARTGRAVFDDVELDTFTRVCQYAYVGDYDSPQWIEEAVDGEITSLPNAPKPICPPIDDGFAILDFWTRKKEKERSALSSALSSSGFGKKSFTMATLRESFDTLGHMCTHSGAKYEPVPNSGPHQNFTPILLGHGQLYVFAEKWGIEDLKSLVIGKLSRTLVYFTLFEARVRDIVEFISYIYSDERTPDTDPLRELTVLYVACNVDIFTENENFMALFTGGGDFTRDLWLIIVNDMLC